MRCPSCNSEGTTVEDTRPHTNGQRRTRRRECPSCGERFSTIEIPRKEFDQQILVIMTLKAFSSLHDDARQLLEDIIT